jgi:GWxTD domain-containing protein
MQQKINAYRLAAGLLLLVSCYGPRDISTINMVSTYRESDHIFHPEFTAYNANDSTVIFFVKTDPSEFLFVRSPDDDYRASIRIHAEIIESYESTRIVDSISKDFSFDITEKRKLKILSLDIPVKTRGKYLIHCFITDNNKGVQEDFFTDLDRSSSPSRQDFLLLDRNEEPLFHYYFNAGDSFRIQYRDTSRSLFSVNYYRRDFPLAYPPFSFDMKEEFDYRPDSSFQVDIRRPFLNLPDEGFYHFASDSGGKEGLTLFRFSSGFPDITNPRQMLEPLRYLTSKKEFEEMKSTPSVKSAVDNFWLTHGGNEEKSRKLIKKYYGRVREANRYFTSYTEGWRTDRGMIYVIFGMPTTIYRSSESESWTYGTPNSSLSLNFFFIKVMNPFTENDFTLSRSPSYESNWYRAVEIWRQGRAYNSFY